MKLDQFNNAVQEFWANLLQSDTVKEIIAFGTKVINLLDSSTGKFLTLTTVIAGLIKLTKNKISETSGGRGKMFPLLSY